MEHENNHYLADKAQIQSELMQVAGATLNEIVKATEATNVTFIKACYDYKKIKDKQFEPNFNNVVGLMVTKISALAGIKDEIDMATKLDLLRFVKTRCTDISLEEIYKAFELERYNEYPIKSNHFQLFGTEYFSEVIKKYRTWKTQLKIQKNISKEDDTLKLPEISESQKEAIFINGIIRVFNEYKQTKILPEPNAHIYDELLSRGLILGANTPKLEKYYSEKMEQAKVEVAKELEIQKTRGDWFHRKNIAREIENVLQGNSNKIITKTKKIVLKEYFDKLISTETSIENKLKK
jgi:hypothetical protein